MLKMNLREVYKMHDGVLALLRKGDTLSFNGVPPDGIKNFEGYFKDPQQITVFKVVNDNAFAVLTVDGFYMEIDVTIFESFDLHILPDELQSRSKLKDIYDHAIGQFDEALRKMADN